MSRRQVISTLAGALLGAASLILPSLAISADLSGTVRSDHGTPAGAGWRVVVHGIDSPGAALATTDDAGAFHLHGLADGRATVMVYAPDQIEALPDPRAGRMVRLTGAAPTRVQLVLNPAAVAAPTFNFTYYRGEYYNNKPTEETADAVLLPGQGVASGIDMELAPGGGTISGRVTRDVGGTGVAGLIVAAFGFDTSVFSFDRTDNDGFYRITGIPADGFVVTAGLAFGDPSSEFVGEYYNNALTISPATVVPVTEAADTPNINFSLGLGGSISGRVTAEVGGQGLANALVSFYESTLGLALITLSDGQGNYSISRLAAGSWKVGVSTGGNYIQEYWNDQLTFETALPVPVTAGQNTGNINMVLAAGGRITGTITNQMTTAPLRDVVVLAERLGDDLTRTTLTDESGNYSVESLPSGNYTVYVPEIGEYWNNQNSPETANPVSVTQGAATTGINFAGFPIGAGCDANPEDVATIRGTVLDPLLDPIPNAELRLYMDVLGNRFQLDQVESDANGAYEFDCVQPGTYYVDARVPFSNYLSEWYDDQNEAGANTVTATAGQVTDNIDFLLALGGSITGRVTATGGTPLAFVEVSARNRATEEVSSELTASDGTYTIAGGPEGGLAEGAYTVWTEGRSTADPSLVPVVLSRFTAASSAPGHVTLEWTTSRESFHAGFHVERRATPDAPPVRLTGDLITGGPDYRFVDNTAPAGTNWYWLVAVDRGGRVETLGPVSIDARSMVASRLLGPAVNPSRGTASIRWDLGREGLVRLRVYDPSGRWIRTLVDGIRPAGAGAAHWDGRAADGSDVAGGLYFLQFDAPDTHERGRLALVR